MSVARPEAEAVAATRIDDRPDDRRIGSALTNGFTWGVASYLVSQTATTGVFILLARHLPPEVFGVFAMAALLVDFIVGQGASALTDALLQRGELARSDLSTAFYASLLVCAGLFALSFPAADALAAIFHEARLTSVLPALAVTVLLAPVSAVASAIALRRLQVRALSFRNAVAAVLGGVVGLGVVFGPHAEWALVAQRWASTLAAVGFLLVLTRWRPGLTVRPKTALAQLSDTGQIWASQALVAGLGRASEAFIGVFLGAAPLGLFRVASRIVTTLHGPAVTPVMALWVPVMSQIADDAEARRRMFLSLSRVSALTCVPAFLGLGLLGPQIAAVLLPPAYAEAGPIIFWLSLAGLFVPLAGNRGPLLTALRRNRAGVFYSLLDLVLVVIVSGVFARYGLRVLMPALFALTAFRCTFALPVMLKAAGVRFWGFLKTVGPAYVAAGVMAVAVVLTGRAMTGAPGVATMAAMVAAGAAAYPLWLVLFHRAWLGEAVAAFTGGAASGRLARALRVAPTRAPSAAPVIDPLRVRRLEVSPGGARGWLVIEDGWTASEHADEAEAEAAALARAAEMQGRVVVHVVVLNQAGRYCYESVVVAPGESRA